MKKLFLILAIGAFVACNDNGADEGTGTDTTVVTPAPDTAVITTPDTITVRPDTTTVKPDTTK